LDKIVVVGGGAAGVAAAEALRAEGHDGSLTLVCGEPHLPYDRPPLSKQVLTGAWDADRTRFRDGDHYAAAGITVVHGTAVSLSVADRTVSLLGGPVLGSFLGGPVLGSFLGGPVLGSFLGGPVLGYDGLIITTGVRPRVLGSGHDLRGVHVLRGLADTAALRAAFDRGPRVVIVGAGFLGMEVAAAARSLGLEVTVVDPLPQPMVRQVGPLVGSVVADLHRAQGVVVRTGVGVSEVVGLDGAVTGVRLDDGSVLPADCVLVAIGAVPSTEWLASSGLALGDGVECDEYLRAADGIYAAGDVASWVSPRYGRRVRVEHRMNATEMGTVAARNLLAAASASAAAAAAASDAASAAASGGATQFDPVPYFWSDQYTVKIQVHGDLTASDTVTLEEGSVADGKFVALFHRDGVPTAVLGWNAPARMPVYRKQLLG
jgi:3-phenylpropionate/trans-cinnamate dioxygenase ferredoxin reductase component